MRPRSHRDGVVRDIETEFAANLGDSRKLFEHRARLEVSLVAPVKARAAAEAARVRAETAATKVEFFTLVRGED